MPTPNGEAGFSPDPNQTLDSPANPGEAEVPASLSPMELQRGRYILKLYKELSDAPWVPLTPSKVSRLIRPLHGWEHTIEIEEAGSKTHNLTRQALDSSVELRLPELPPPREITRASDSLDIKVKDDDMRNRDLLALLMVESQYPRHLLRQAMKAKENASHPPSELSIKFSEAKDVYLQEGDTLTDTQTLILSGMTHYSSQKELARDLGIKPDKLSKLVKELCAVVGIQWRRGGPDSYIELMLVAIAAGIAKTDHVPKAHQDDLDSFRPSEREVLAKYYSPDPDKRAAVHAARTKNAMSLVWQRVYKKLGIDGQHSRYEAVLYAAKNRILKLPDASMLKWSMPQPDQAPESVGE